MSRLSVRCIQAAFLFLFIGIGLGLIFAVDRTQGAYWRTLHATVNLWGWVTLLIYGMAYHMLPRFTGRPLTPVRVAETQTWLAIAGVAFISFGWIGVLSDLPGARTLVVAGALMQFVAAVLFTFLASMLLRPS